MDEFTPVCLRQSLISAVSLDQALTNDQNRKTRLNHYVGEVVCPTTNLPNKGTASGNWVLRASLTKPFRHEHDGK